MWGKAAAIFVDVAAVLRQKNHFFLFIFLAKWKRWVLIPRSLQVQIKCSIFRYDYNCRFNFLKKILRFESICACLKVIWLTVWKWHGLKDKAFNKVWPLKCSLHIFGVITNQRTKGWTHPLKKLRFATNKADRHKSRASWTATDGPTDGPTDRPTDKAAYRVACTRLKIKLRLLKYNYGSKSKI